MTDKFVKIIDYSLLPFSILILSKVIGLFFIFDSLNIDWGVGGYANQLLSATPIVYAKDLMVVATYSNLIMYFVMFIYFSIQLLISNLRQNATKNNKLLLRLLKFEKINFFQGGVYLYTRIFVAGAYLWLATIYILIDAIIGRTAGWLVLVSLVLSSLVTLMLFKDTAKELDSILHSNKQKIHF
jgi:hypothetical protein